MARIVPVDKEDANLLLLSETLQTLIIDNGFITAASVRGLVETGVRNEHTFYLLGDEHSSATSQSFEHGSFPLGNVGRHGRLGSYVWFSLRFQV